MQQKHFPFYLPNGEGRGGALLLLLLFLTLSLSSFAANSDSIKVMSLFNSAPHGLTTNEYMAHFGRSLEGTPYVAKTLEVNSPEEKLVVNLRELDCTTFTETVLALSLCAANGTPTYADFCRMLRMIRYRQGVVSYPDRLHYFSSWIDDNTQLGFVREVTADKSPFTGRQTLNINYMSTHTSAYPQLSDASLVRQISATEKALTGKTVSYIPKALLKNHSLLRDYIHTGDIIAIVTSKSGLDTSHIGIALWHTDGTLHLLNASQIHKKVIDEPMTIYTYMQKHPTQIGIRVIKPTLP